MKRSPEFWFLMTFATALFAFAGWVLLKDLIDKHFILFVLFYGLFVVLGDGLTALATEKFAPTFIHIGPGERFSKNHLTSETAKATGDFDEAGRGRVVVRSEVWRAELFGEAPVRVSEKDELQIVGRDGLTLLVIRVDQPL